MRSIRGTDCLFVCLFVCSQTDGEGVGIHVPNGGSEEPASPQFIRSNRELNRNGGEEATPAAAAATAS